MISRYSIKHDRQLDLLRWLLTAWDNQWLARTGAVYGPPEAGKLYTRVRAAYARLEMRVLLNILGKPSAADLPDAAEMLQAFFELTCGEQGYEVRFEPVQTAAAGGLRLQLEVIRLDSLATLTHAAEIAGESAVLARELLWLAWMEALLPAAQLQVIIRNSAGHDVVIIESQVRLGSPEPGSSPGARQSWPELAPVDEEISPIAAALQIPFDQIAPASSPVDLSHGIPPAALAAIDPSLTKPRSGLSARVNRTTLPPSNESTPLSVPEFPTLNPSPEVGVDPETGRSLFSGDPELDARARVERTKALPAISRIFMSREARELMAKRNSEPQVKTTSLATNIDLILQRKLNELRQRTPEALPGTFRVIGGPQGALQIVIGHQTYNSVGDVPAGPYHDLLEQAVAEWTSRQ